MRPRGIGHLRGWTTDVALPGAGPLRADAVLTAPEDDVPLLFVEVDHHGEPPAAVAAKIAAYRDAFRLRVTDPHTRAAVPLWSTRWPAPGTGHPPLALVFAKGVPPPVLARVGRRSTPRRRGGPQDGADERGPSEHPRVRRGAPPGGSR